MSYSLQVFCEYQIVEIEKKKEGGGELCFSSPYIPYLLLGKAKQRQMKDQGQEICEVLKCIVQSVYALKKSKKKETINIITLVEAIHLYVSLKYRHWSKDFILKAMGALGTPRRDIWDSLGIGRS